MDARGTLHLLSPARGALCPLSPVPALWRPCLRKEVTGLFVDTMLQKGSELRGVGHLHGGGRQAEREHAGSCFVLCRSPSK